MTLLLAVAVAAAAPPEGATPVLATPGVHDQWAAWREGRGLAVDPLACERFVEGAILCLRYQGRWVTEAELATWDVSFAEARAVLAARAPASTPTLDVHTIEGMPGVHYWRADGAWVAGALLDPHLLQLATASQQVAVAVPNDSVLLAWVPGDVDLDKVLAVAAAEAYASQPNGVSATVWLWTGSSWTTYGEATAR